MEVTIKFSSASAAGAVKAWNESNLGKVRQEIREAQRTDDRTYLRNLRTEQAGLIAVRIALQDVPYFEGHER